MLSSTTIIRDSIGHNAQSCGHLLQCAMTNQAHATPSLLTCHPKPTVKVSFGICPRNTRQPKVFQHHSSMGLLPPPMNHHTTINGTAMFGLLVHHLHSHKNYMIFILIPFFPPPRATNPYHTKIIYNHRNYFNFFSSTSIAYRN
jgi:hypothetical protein